MDGHMAPAADDQGLALAGGHYDGPGRSFRPPLAPEVTKPSDVVHLYMLLGTAELARLGQQSLFQVAPSGVPDLGRVVVEDCIRAVAQRDAAPLGYQRLLACVSIDYTLRPLKDPSEV